MVNIGGALPAPRACATWWLHPPYPAGGLEALNDDPTPEFIWRNIERLANVPEIGRELFSGNLATKNRLHREFRNFVRQARLYDDAASLVHGTSAALLLYYCVLNLAKAELLVTDPGAVEGVRIHHGLAFNPTDARTLAGDAVQVQDGVFRRLYAKRSGVSITSGTQLPVKRLLINVPEIGWEVDTVGLGRCAIRRLIHGILTDGVSTWTVIGIHGEGQHLSNGVTDRHVARSFRRVDWYPTWRDMFAITRRNPGGGFAFFEEKEAVPAALIDGALSSDNVIHGCLRTWQKLAPFVDESTLDAYDALLCPSLYVARSLPMLCSLARYALMFYVSSLVRYKPSQLDPITRAEQAWLLDAFVSQARVPLLHNALTGITGKIHVFHNPTSFRV
jgi:hypothetical protein